MDHSLSVFFLLQIKCNFFSFVTYNDLKSVEQGRSISQAAKLKVARTIFWDVTIGSSAEEHFLYITHEGVAQVLHRVHHHSAINDIT